MNTYLVSIDLPGTKDFNPVTYVSTVQARNPLEALRNATLVPETFLAGQTEIEVNATVKLI